MVKRELPETHLTAHVLRHTYAARLFEAGLDIKEIQYLAGHSTVDNTHYDRRSREGKTAEKVGEAMRENAWHKGSKNLQYSFSIRFPAKSRHNEGCPKVR